MPTSGEVMASVAGSTGTLGPVAVGTGAVTAGRRRLRRVVPWVTSSSQISVPATSASISTSSSAVRPAISSSGSFDTCPHPRPLPLGEGAFGSHTLDVRAVAGVDADLVTGRDEKGHVDGEPRFELGGLVATSGGIAFEA